MLRKAAVVTFLAVLTPLLGRAHDASPTLGPWSRATVLGVMRTRWLSEAQFSALKATTNPDELVAFFQPRDAQTLVIVGLQTGFDCLWEARDKPREPIAIPDKNVDIQFQFFKSTERSKTVFQALVVVRLMRVPVLPLPPPRGVAGVNPQIPGTP